MSKSEYPLTARFVGYVIGALIILAVAWFTGVTDDSVHFSPFEKFVSTILIWIFLTVDFDGK